MSRLTYKTGGGGILRGTAAASLLITAALLLPSCGTSSGAEALPPEPSASSRHFPPSPDQGTGRTVVPVIPEPTDTASPDAVTETTAPPPRTLTLPTIAAGSDLMQVGLREDGTLEVPPGKPGSPAGWYIHSPTPGEPGPAVILGHVNAEGGGPGIFADLRKLQPGDDVEVTREDGSTAVFSVEYGEQYPKDSFPTEKVYGNTEGPELRLITCDGYDAKTGTFADNYVVYARLNQ